MKMKQTNKSSLDEKIHVAFCIDKNYTIQVLLVINSILINNKSKSKYKFYIIENNLSKLDKLHIKLFVKFHGQEVEIINVDTTEIDGGINLYRSFEGSKLKWAQHITRISLARVILPDVLMKIDKVLYLDSDIIVLSDLSDLWKTDINNYYAAMVKDIICIKEKPYFNGGVILMNLKTLRDNNVSKQMVDLLKKQKFLIPDQDVINIVMEDKIKVIPYFYNFISNNEINDRKDFYSAKISHCLGFFKPWSNIFNKNNIFFETYQNYWDKSYLKIFKIKYLVPSLKYFIKKYK